MSKALYKKIGIASLIMTSSIFLSRIIGLVREMVIAAIGGRGPEVDAYQIAFIIPELLNHIVASGFASVTFIPIFSSYLVKNKEDEGWRIFSIILTSFGTLLIIFIAVCYIFTPQFISMTGLKDPYLIEKTIKMTRIIIPAQFFFFTGGMFMAVQFAKKKFFLPALAPLFYNAGIICGGLFLGKKFGMEGFSWGVLAGAFIGSFAIQYFGAKKQGMRFHIEFNLKHPDFKKYILLTLPLMVGLSMMFSTEILMRFFGSYLPRGGIADLNYGFRVMHMLVGLFGQAVGVAAFPFLASLAAEKKLFEMNQLINNTMKYLAMVIPISVLLMVLRQEVIMILFQRGEFNAIATRLTSQTFSLLLISAFAFSAQTVVVRGFYAMQNTLYPAIFGTIAVILSIPLYIFGMHFFGTAGIALSISASAIFQVILLFTVWNRRSSNKESVEVYKFFIKIILLSIPIGIFFEWFKVNILFRIDTTTLFGSLYVSAIIGVLFLILFGTAAYFLRFKEIIDIMYAVRERIPGFPNKFTKS